MKPLLINIWRKRGAVGKQVIGRARNLGTFTLQPLKRNG